MRRSRPGAALFRVDPFADDTSLQALLNCHLAGARLEALGRAWRGVRLPHDVVTVIGPAARRYEQRTHLPELARWDGLGRRTEEIVFDPSYHEAGRVVWRSGLVALSSEPGRAFEQAVLLYLLFLEGEAGHACPATCTIGLARALRQSPTTTFRGAFLPGSRGSRL